MVYNTNAAQTFHAGLPFSLEDFCLGNNPLSSPVWSNGVFISYELRLDAIVRKRYHMFTRDVPSSARDTMSRASIP